jgi:hypothetical protein
VVFVRCSCGAEQFRVRFLFRVCVILSYWFLHLSSVCSGDLFDDLFLEFSFPFVLSRFVPETLLCVLSSFSLSHLSDVGHIEVVCVHVLVLCHGMCVSFSCAFDYGWLVVCSVRVLEVDVSPVCVLNRRFRGILGVSPCVPCVHSVYDVFLAQ